MTTRRDSISRGDEVSDTFTTDIFTDAEIRESIDAIERGDCIGATEIKMLRAFLDLRQSHAALQERVRKVLDECARVTFCNSCYDRRAEHVAEILRGHYD